ncbi:Kinesin-like protein kif21b, partial [Linderina pennispora]
MLACISPSNKNHAESLNTIRYANRARNIRNKVAVNFDKNSSAELSILKTEVARLRGEIAKLKLLRRQSSLMPSDQAAGQTMARLEAELSRLEAVNMEITEKLEQAVRQAAVLEIERDSLRRKIVDLGGTVDTKMADSAIAMLDSSLLKYPGAAVPMGSVGNSTPSGIQSPRPNSIFTDGNPGILSDQMLNTMDRELSDQAERHEQQIDSVRHHYESKLELLQETLAIVQKERDVALQRLANANKSSASLSSGSNGPPNRRVLGLENGTSTPTKLRQPSRIAKASVSRKSSSVDIPGRSSPVPVVRELQEQLEQLRRENQALLDNAAADSESLALQVQEQAREIATLRRKRTGRTDSRRFSFLPHRDNTWGVARDVAEEENTPNLLRAAFIKKVLEGELQRCVQARQMLRERDSYLSKQDELMNEQNDMMLLQLQGDDIDGDHDPSDEPANPASPGTTMEWANQRIEIIDAELHYLDLKVRDVEAEIARLSEDTTESASDLQGSGLLSRPLLLNMSGLAMRMVEDVVRIDYRAFADMFDAMEPKDVTGLSYLLMQDIIDLRLMSHREEIARKELEEQTMDLRRTLLVMQKTAVNAAL